MDQETNPLEESQPTTAKTEDKERACGGQGLVGCETVTGESSVSNA